MSSIVVVGGQWGDEGKGKIVDRLTDRVQVVVRYQGGPNAGHTIITGGNRFALHHLPTGILRPGVLAVVGNGVVIDPASLLEEIEQVRGAGIRVEENLRISDRAHLILPEHRQLDSESEEQKGDTKIGTTKRGVGPAYEGKVSRLGLRMCDLRDADLLREKLEAYRQARHEPLAQSSTTPELTEVLKQYQGFGETLEPFLANTSDLLNQRLESGQHLLFEGAQGTMLDLDHGTYPFVTSSNSTSGGACAGSGVGPTRITGVLGIFKAYCTRVGAGPFPTEQKGSVGDRIRKIGREFGTTTGRPRRCGWFDGVLGRYAVRINGMESAALTLCDVLDSFDEIPVAVAYEYQHQRIQTPPSATEAFSRCQPVYESLKGWKTSLKECRRFEDLPSPFRAYVDRIEKILGCEIALISVGPEREATLHRPGSRLEGWFPQAA